jgi:hypothetical protein
VPLYLVLDEVLTRGAACISAGFSALDKRHLRRRLPYGFEVYRVTYVSGTVTQEDADPRLGIRFNPPVLGFLQGLLRLLRRKSAVYSQAL